MSGNRGPRIGVVGAGIIGLAVARRLAQDLDGAAVTVLEKERAIALHQTGRNSGVVHSGVYYAPGSLKARLCRRGVRMLEEYCARRGLPFERRGKLIVALHDGELQRLRELERRGRANGVPGLRWLEGARLLELEPRIAGIAALHSPSTAITDYRAVAAAFADDLAAAGGQVVLGARVTAIGIRRSTVRVATTLAELELDRLVICAGLHADRLARLAGDRRDPVIVPFRGEYHRLRPDREHLVRGLVYPVPDPSYPFLGVHFTPRVGGGVDVGPNAVLALAREGYRRRDVRVADVLETARCAGFRRLAARHWRTGLRELHGSLSRRAFARQARRYLPELSDDDLLPAAAGVRAQALDRDGSLVDDFRIATLGPVTAVRNAPSPGATCSLAIAEHIVQSVTASPPRRPSRP